MRYGISLPEPAVADHDIVDDQILSLGSIDFEILHTPGHTLGGCCLRLLIEDDADHLFVGDTLLAGSVGRTDLENTGGDFNVLSNSIRTKLWPLTQKPSFIQDMDLSQQLGMKKQRTHSLATVRVNPAFTHSESTLNQAGSRERLGRRVELFPCCNNPVICMLEDWCVSILVDGYDVFGERIPARCWIAPEIPTAM